MRQKYILEDDIKEIKPDKLTEAEVIRRENINLETGENLEMYKRVAKSKTVKLNLGGDDK